MTEVGFVRALSDDSATMAFERSLKSLSPHHAFWSSIPVPVLGLEAVKTGLLLTETKHLDLPLVSHHPLSEVFGDLVLVLLQLLKVVVLEALVLLELASPELLAANLALYLYFLAVTLDVLTELRSRQLLELLAVADVAAILVTLVELGVLLQLADRLPRNLSVRLLVAFVRELAEVNTVPNDWVNVSEEVSLRVAVRAGRIVRFEIALGAEETLRASSGVDSVLLVQLHGLGPPRSGADL